MGLTKLDEEIILRGAQANGLPVSYPAAAQDVAAAILRDKKRTDGGVAVCVPLRLGETRLHTLPLEQVREYVEMGLMP